MNTISVRIVHRCVR